MKKFLRQSYFAYMLCVCCTPFFVTNTAFADSRDGTISISEELNTGLLCDNVTDAGSIDGGGISCGTILEPAEIVSTELPSGGSGDIEYVWLYSFVNVPNIVGNTDWQLITNANDASHTPQNAIEQTTYFIRCARRSGCTFFAGESNVVSFIINSEPTVNCTFVNGTCDGDVLGSASVSIDGDDNPYTILWSNGATTATISGISAGLYSVTVTDANGCTASCDVEVETSVEPLVAIDCVEPGQNFTASGVEDSDPSCGSDPNYTFYSGSLLPGNKYWTVSGGNFEEFANGSAALTGIVTNVANPNWQFELNVLFSGKTFDTPDGSPKDGNCVNDVSDVEWYYYTETSGFLLGLNALDGAVVQLSRRGEAFQVGVGAHLNDPLVFGASGWINFIVLSQPTDGPVLNTNNSNGDFNFELPGGPGLLDVPSCTTICAGGSVELFATALAGNGTYTYLWSTGETTASITVSPTMTTTYTVTVTSNGCVASASIEVIVNDAPQVVCSSEDGLCGDVASASVTASGGSAPYSYLWSNGATTTTISGISAGMYSVTVTDANGCTASCDVEVETSVEPLVAIDCVEPGQNFTASGVEDSDPSCGSDPNYTFYSGSLLPGNKYWTVSGGNFEEFANGSAALTGIVTNVANPNWQFELNVLFSGKTFDTPDGSPKDGNCVNDVSDVEWYYYTETAGYLLGLNALDGAVVQLSRRGEAFQVGVGAHLNDPLVFGASGWINFLVLSQPTDGPVLNTNNSNGDFNFELPGGPGLLDVPSCTTICAGGSVELFATALAGNGTYTYLWSTGETTASITVSPTMTTTYTVTVTSNGCVASASIEVIVNDAPQVVCSFENALCGDVASASVTASGGTEPYSYLWSNGATTATISGISAGLYAVTVTDANGCTASCDVEVIVTPTVLAECSSEDGLCGETASASVTASGGTAPYSYLWSNGATTATISGISAGLYAVTVTDANGCTASCDVAVETSVEPLVAIDCVEPGQNFTASGVEDSDPSCGSDPNYTFYSGSLLPGNKYWTVSGGNFEEFANGSAALTGIVTNVANPNWQFELNVLFSGKTFDTPDGSPKDGNCVNDVSDVEWYYYTETSGFLLGLNALDGAVVQLSRRGEAFQVGVGAHLNDPLVFGASGWINFIVLSQPTDGPVLNTNNSNGDFNFELPGGPGLLDVPSCTTICAGGSVELFATALAGNGTYTYLWSTGETTASITVSPTMTTTYTVTVTSNGCVASASIEVIVNDAPQVVCSSEDGLCGDVASASVTASGGSAPYSYLWSNGATTTTISGISAGMYSVTVTDANGCTASCDVEVETSVEPLVAIDCVEPGQNFTASGVEDSDPSCGSDPNYTFYSGSLLPGNKYWTVSGGNFEEFANGSAALTGIVTNVANPNWQFELNVLFSGKTFDTPDGSPKDGNCVNDVSDVEWYYYTETSGFLLGLNALDGAVVQLSRRGEAFQVGVGAHLNDPLVFGASGWINFLVLSQPTDGPVLNTNNSNGDFNFELPGGPGLLDVPSCTTICAGGSVELFATALAGNGTYTYIWSTGETTASITVSPTMTTTYTVTVTSNGCVASASIEVIVNDAPQVVCSFENALCGETASASVTASGGTEPYSYLWSNGATTASISGIPAGMYSVTVTDANGCTASCDVEVGTSVEPLVAINCVEPGQNFTASGVEDSDPSCGSDPNYTFYSGSLLPGNKYWTVSGGNFEEFANGSAALTGIVTNVANPNWQFELNVLFSGKTFDTPDGSPKDGNCVNDVSDVEWYYYTETSGFLLGLNALDGAVVQLSRRGEAFQVGVGAHLNDPLVFGASGWINFIVLSQPTDGPVLNTNNSNGDFNFELPGGPGLLDVPSCTTICAGGSVELFATALAGNGTYTYLWSTGETTASITVSPTMTTTYTITVTSNGCEASASIEVTVNDAPQVVCSAVGPNCGNSEGSATVEVTSGLQPYTYLWSNGATTATITGLAQGNYSVAVTDANGCTAECSVDVIANEAPELVLTCADFEPLVSSYGFGDYTRSCSGSGLPISSLWTGNAFNTIIPSAGGCGSNRPRWTLIDNASFVENFDGTAQLIMTVASKCNPSKILDVTLSLSGRTFDTPSGSPVLGASTNCVDGDTDTSDWYYYTNVVGTIIGQADLDGLIIGLVETGGAFQIGTGANQYNEFGSGASTWLLPTIISQPTSGPMVTVVPHFDINIDLDQPGLLFEPQDCLTICEGESTIITANTTGDDITYLWSTGETTQSISVSPATTTIYSVNVQIANGCPASAEITVTVEDCSSDFDCPTLEANNGDVCNIDPSTSGTVVNCECVPDFVEILGCTDINACNYNSSANTDDGTCAFVNGICEVCIDGAIVDQDEDNDGICDFDEIVGCTAVDACNYNMAATDDDGSCVFISEICDVCIDGQIVNQDIDGDGFCVGEDCDDNDMDITIVGALCDDGDDTTENDIIGDDCNCSGTAIGLENDDCINAIVISCGSTVSGSTVGASSAPGGTPFCEASSTIASGVWYSYSNPQEMIVTVDLSGSAYDTKIFVYSGECDDLTCVTGDDDGGTGTTSSATFNATSGVEYSIFVTGFGTNSGEYTMQIACEELPACTAPGSLTAMVVSNSCIDGEGTFDVNVTLAQNGSATTYLVSNDVDGQSAIISLDGTASFTGFTSGSNITFTASAEDFDECNVSGSASFTCPPPAPANDECEGATALSCGDALSGMSFIGATQSIDDNCGGAGIADVWYSFETDGSNNYTVSETSGTDVVVSLFSGNSCGDLEEIQPCQDFPENFTVSDAGTYYFLVRPYFSSGVSLGVSLECVAPIENDDPSGAIAITCGETINGNTSGATVSGISATCGSFTSLNPFDLFYTFEADGLSDYEISLNQPSGSSGLDGVVFVYQQNGEELVNLGCSDSGNPEEITLSSPAAGIYLIRIFDYSGTAAFTLDLTCTEALPFDCPALEANIGDLCGDGGTVSNDCDCIVPVTLINDNPEGALTLACGETIDGSSIDATISGISQACGIFSSPNALDVFYTFEADGLSSYTISLGGDADFDGVLFLYSGSAENLISIDCADNSVAGGLETLSLTTPDAGAYFVRIFGYFEPGTFELSLNCATPTPLAVGQNINIELDENGLATITPDDVDNGSTAPQGLADKHIDINTFDCTNIGENMVTLTITDINGNIASCEAIVTVIDAMAPSVICQNATVYLDNSNIASITLATIDGGCTDNCGIESYTIDLSEFDCDDVGEHTVTLTVTDAQGNVSQGTSLVTVAYSLNPQAICQNMEVSLDETGFAEVTASDINNASEVMCGFDSMNISSGQTEYTCADEDSYHYVHLTVTNLDGNAGTCYAQVHVISVNDEDGDGVSDACDTCLGDDSTGDTDNDGICEENDACPGFDDLINPSNNVDVQSTLSSAGIEATDGMTYYCSGPFYGGTITAHESSTVRIGGTGNLSVSLSDGAVLEVMPGSNITFNSLQIAASAGGLVIYPEAEVHYNSGLVLRAPLVNCGTFHVAKLYVDHSGTLTNNGTLKIFDSQAANLVSGAFINNGNTEIFNDLEISNRGAFENNCKVEIRHIFRADGSTDNYGLISVGSYTKLVESGVINLYNFAMFITNDNIIAGKYVGHGTFSLVKTMNNTIAYSTARIEGPLMYCDVTGIEFVESNSFVGIGAVVGCGLLIEQTTCNSKGNTPGAKINSSNTAEQEIFDPAMVAQFRPEVSNSTNHLEELQISLWPNPSNGNITLSFVPTDGNQIRLEISDLKGEILKVPFEGSWTKGQLFQTNIDMGKLPDGIYFVRVIDQANVSVEKIVIAK